MQLIIILKVLKVKEVHLTWIIGTSSLMDNANLVSDVCVTFTLSNGDKKYIDCLQKVYYVGKYVLAGFAGSVKIGLKMIEYLNKELSKTGENEAWNMEIVLNTVLPRMLRRIYRLSDENEKRLRCSLLIASVHPSKNNGDGPYALTYIHKLDSPDFEPKKAKFNEVFSIGSGSGVQLYVKAVNKLKNDMEFLKMSVMSKQPYAFSLAAEIRKEVEMNPISGVSKYFLAGSVRRGEAEIVEVLIHKYTDDGNIIEDNFPKLASGSLEFHNYCSQHNISAECAIA